MSISKLCVIAVCFSLLSSLAGCAEAQDARVNRIILTEEPADAGTIAAAKKNLPAGRELVIVGQVGKGDIDPFDANAGLFVISDIPPAHAAPAKGKHNAATCPFCKRRAADAPTAVVQLTDEAGKVLPTRADKLLPLKKGDVVVVRGKGTLNKQLDTLMITASGVYVRK
jgi:hypothetical protein